MSGKMNDSETAADPLAQHNGNDEEKALLEQEAGTDEYERDLDELAEDRAGNECTPSAAGMSQSGHKRSSSGAPVTSAAYQKQKRRDSSAGKGQYARIGASDQVREQFYTGLRPRHAIILLVIGIFGLVVLYKVVAQPALRKEQSVGSWSQGGSYTPIGVPHHPQASAGMAGVGQDWNKIIHEDLPNAQYGPLTNGSHWFKPTVLIISLDGVRADYLTRGLTPHLLDISRKGMRAAFMRPIFPSLTFPNHWAMQTGLYAESHGIIANDFWDPKDNTEFKYTDSSKSWQAKWWSGEPMWRTATKNGLKSANLMWPGPPQMADHSGPTYFQPFMDHTDWTWKLNMLLEWIDLPDDERPQLIMGYLPEVDQEGHHTGPDSPELQSRLRDMDTFAKELMAQLAARHLDNILDVIFVSDHGMTATSDTRVVYLDELLGEEGFNGILHKVGWPSCGLTFKPHVDEASMVEKMKAGAAASGGGFAYYTPQNMPEEWHFAKNERISPHWLIPEVGWAMTDKHEHFYEMKGHYEPLGNHGYNNSHSDMYAMFVHHGPAAKHFRKTPTSNADGTVVIPGFDNIELYNLVMGKLLQVENLAPNNGSAGFWDQYFQNYCQERGLGTSDLTKGLRRPDFPGLGHRYAAEIAQKEGRDRQA